MIEVTQEVAALTAINFGLLGIIALFNKQYFTLAGCFIMTVIWIIIVFS